MQLCRVSYGLVIPLKLYLKYVQLAHAKTHFQKKKLTVEYVLDAVV